MKFRIDISLGSEILPLDKNRVILSLLKTVMSNYDDEIFEKMYGKGRTMRKNMTFSVYMPNAVFKKDEIEIPKKEISLHISTSDLEMGMTIYNSFLLAKDREIELKDKIKMTIEKIQLMKEEIITDDEILVKTLSPICVRNHFNDNSKTRYLSLDDEEGKKIFLRNIKNQLFEEFGEDRNLDVKNFKFDIIYNKTIVVKNYDIWVHSNKAILRFSGKPYILKYLIDSGVGSKKSSGFGMIKIV